MNCLITKLRESVDNTNMHKLGELTLTITNNQNSITGKNWANIYIPAGSYVKVVGGKVGECGSSLNTDPTAWYSTIASTTSSVIAIKKDDDATKAVATISSKYDITRLFARLDNFSLYDVKYLSSISGLGIQATFKDASIKDVSYRSFSQIQLWNTGSDKNNLTGSLSDLNMTNLAVLHLYNCNISGTLTDLLPTSHKLAGLILSGTPLIKGNLKTFLDGVSSRATERDFTLSVDVHNAPNIEVDADIFPAGKTMYTITFNNGTWTVS